MNIGQELLGKTKISDKDLICLVLEISSQISFSTRKAAFKFIRDQENKIIEIIPEVLDVKSVT